MSPTTEEALDLAAIQARADAATAGPWARGIHTGEFELLDDRGDWLGGIEHFDDAEFIAHAREDVPALLARVRALVAERDDALAKLAQVREWVDAPWSAEQGEDWDRLDAILAQPDDEAETKVWPNDSNDDNGVDDGVGY